MSDLPLEAVWVARADEVPPSLWAQCFAPPLEGCWWYRALERSGLEDQFSFRYLLLRQGGSVVAMAPTFVMDVPMRLVVPPALLPWVDALGHVLPWLRAQRTLFVGSPCTDEGHIGLLPGVDSALALRRIDAALRGEMRRTGAALRVWKDFPVDCDAALGALARESGLFRLVSFPGTVVDLPAGGKDKYLQSLRTKQRHLFKKKLRRSEEQVALDVELLRQPDAATLDALFALFWQTYEKATTRFERLNRRFFELVAAEPAASFIVLREHATGDAVAFMLCFEFAGRFINKFIGIDYRRPREWLLYFRLWDAAVDRAVTIGARALQSGQTGYGPKIDLGHRLVPLTNYCAHRNPLVHRLYAAVARGVDWSTLDPALAAALAAHPELRRAD
ncbi:GNAT family N-acetyltransferase [Methylibium sp.]|uniref:GNAT family N-acetyltransferase n=1 Tax=Methylibium sp. TaxID=2067992 RepID=UPI003D0C022A